MRLLTELPGLDLLAQVEHSSAAFPVADLLDDGWQTGLLGRYYYVRTAAREGPDGQPVVCLRTCMIEHSFEDPATGSAACFLAAFLSSVKDKQTTRPAATKSPRASRCARRAASSLMSP